MRKYPERYRDILEGKPGSRQDRDEKKAVSVNTKVVPRVSLRDSGSESDSDSGDSDVGAAMMKKGLDKDLEALNILKSGLAAKAKEAIEKKMPKPAVLPGAPPTSTAAVPARQDSPGKKERVERMLAAVGVTPVSEISLPEKPKPKLKIKPDPDVEERPSVVQVVQAVQLPKTKPFQLKDTKKLALFGPNKQPLSLASKSPETLTRTVPVPSPPKVVSSVAAPVECVPAHRPADVSVTAPTTNGSTQRARVKRSSSSSSGHKSRSSSESSSA